MLVAACATSQWAVAWSAVPGRIGEPVSTIATTPLDANNSPAVRLAVLGDVGTGSEDEWETAALVATAAASQPFDGLVLLGDNVYPSGDPTRLQATVFDPFDPILRQGTALLPTLGNHDIMDGHAAGQVEALGMPGRWYATEIGPLLLLSLDSNLVHNADQLRWLESTFAAGGAEWVIVTMHHPPFSAGYHGSDDDIQETWVPLFEAHGVDLVLSGHDHDYQRTVPINGVTYVVSGGGARTRPTERADFTAFAAATLHFVDIAIWGERLELTAVSSSGAFDHVVIDKSGSP
jgi:3',5'-cyclic AMP phosphodiesterase CpdA